MDLNDLDHIFDFETVEDDGPDPPDYRATIRDNRLTVVGWAPHLLGSGPNAKLLAERAEAGVTVADLRVPDSGERELLVEYLAVADRRRADRLLARWAESVGHTRVWFPDRLCQPGLRPTARRRRGRVPHLRRRLAGLDPRLLGAGARGGVLPQPLPDLQRRPAAVVLAAFQ